MKNQSAIDRIKNRTLSKHDQEVIHGMAAKGGEQDEAPEQEQKPAAPKAPTPAAGSIEGLVAHYYAIFSKQHEDPVACALVQSCITLEGSALIAKAIKDSK